MDEISDELLEALNQARNVNYENERLANIYGGNFAFVKTYKDAIEQYSNISAKDIEKMLLIVYENTKNILDSDSLSIQGKRNFVDTTKHNITTLLLKEGLYKNIKEIYDHILNELYSNIQLFR